MSNALIIGEVALALVVLAGAGSFVRSLANLTVQPFGFDREHVLVVSIDPGLARYEVQPARAVVSADARTPALVPGVKSASFSHYSPFNGCCWASQSRFRAYTPQPGERRSRG